MVRYDVIINVVDKTSGAWTRSVVQYFTLGPCAIGTKTFGVCLYNFAFSKITNSQFSHPTTGTTYIAVFRFSRYIRIYLAEIDCRIRREALDGLCVKHIINGSNIKTTQLLFFER